MISSCRLETRSKLYRAAWASLVQSTCLKEAQQQRRFAQPDPFNIKYQDFFLGGGVTLAELVEHAPRLQSVCPRCSSPSLKSDLWPFAACHSRHFHNHNKGTKRKQNIKRLWNSFQLRLWQKNRRHCPWFAGMYDIHSGDWVAPAPGLGDIQISHYHTV